MHTHLYPIAGQQLGAGNDMGGGRGGWYEPPRAANFHTVQGKTGPRSVAAPPPEKRIMTRANEIFCGGGGGGGVATAAWPRRRWHSVGRCMGLQGEKENRPMCSRLGVPCSGGGAERGGASACCCGGALRRRSFRPGFWCIRLPCGPQFKLAPPPPHLCKSNALVRAAAGFVSASFCF